MSATTLDELAALGEELLAGLARLRETVDAMGRSLSGLERTTAELRQDVTRLGDRVDRLKPRIDGIELRPDGRGTANGQNMRCPPWPTVQLECWNDGRRLCYLQ